MSLISDSKRVVDLNKVPGRLALYEELIVAAELIFTLDGKGLEEAIKEHAQNLSIYDSRLQECKTIEDAIKSRIEEIESELYRHYNEGMQMKLQQRDIIQYIKGDKKYVDAYAILLEVIHIRRQLESIVNCLDKLGWNLTNITKLRIAQLEHIAL